MPNSLGPGELLQHYGTDEQKDSYLPGLARGDEIPCFALTSPEAGSDAGAIPDVGTLCMGEWQGLQVLGMRLTWNKRYITLAPVATVLDLVFKRYDPNHLLSDNATPGITCTLIPTSIPGVEIGKRHFPLNVPFQNGPPRGTDVFVPIDYIIGGPKMAGQGWRMLVECLSVGRGITLPSTSTGCLKSIALATGVYAHIRRQFKISIGKMEGIEEPLARIASNTYVMDAAASLKAYGLAQGEKPAVLSAIVKYHCTHRGQQSIIDAMDILSQLYLASAALKRSDDEGRNKEDLPLVHWSVQDSLHKAEQALDNLLRNFPNRFIAGAMRLVVFPFGRVHTAPSDHLDNQLAKILQVPSATRSRLGHGQYLTPSEHNPSGLLEAALADVIAAEPIHQRLCQATGRDLPFTRLVCLANRALGEGGISADEAKILVKAEESRVRSINVDDFAPGALAASKPANPVAPSKPQQHIEAA